MRTEWPGVPQVVNPHHYSSCNRFMCGVDVTVYVTPPPLSFSHMHIRPCSRLTTF